MEMNEAQFQDFCIHFYTELRMRGFEAGIHMMNNSCDFICNGRALTIKRGSCSEDRRGEYYRKLTGEKYDSEKF